MKNTPGIKLRLPDAFTLLELLFVIIIIGILTGISLPNFRKSFTNLQLKRSAQDLQALMNYLHQRSIIEGMVVILTIDNEGKKCFAQKQEQEEKIKSLTIPQDIEIETDNNQVLFYPDGTIDKVDIQLTNQNNQSINLTTKGVYSRVKLQIPQ